MRWQGWHLKTRTALRLAIRGKLPNGIISRSHFSHAGGASSLAVMAAGRIRDPRAQDTWGIYGEGLIPKLRALHGGPPARRGGGMPHRVSTILLPAPVLRITGVG